MNSWIKNRPVSCRTPKWFLASFKEKSHKAVRGGTDDEQMGSLGCCRHSRNLCDDPGGWNFLLCIRRSAFRNHGTVRGAGSRGHRPGRGRSDCVGRSDRGSPNAPVYGGCSLWPDSDAPRQRDRRRNPDQRSACRIDPVFAGGGARVSDAHAGDDSRDRWPCGGCCGAAIAFDEALGRIVAQMAEKERNAVLRRQEALGWTVVGRIRMLEQLSGHTQERLGSAVRDAGVLSAMVERETPLAQESLGSAILVASAAQSAVSTGNVPSIPVALTPGVAGIQALREIPYPAGALLFAALFMIVWGVRCVAESGPTLPSVETSGRAKEPYRKTG